MSATRNFFEIEKILFLPEVLKITSAIFKIQYFHSEYNVLEFYFPWTVDIEIGITGSYTTTWSPIKLLKHYINTLFNSYHINLITQWQ